MSVGHEDACSGSKIYALDIKEGSDRSDFIGKSNTTIGAVILLLGGFYATLTFAGNLILFSMIALGISVGLLLSVTMKNENRKKSDGSYFLDYTSNQLNLYLCGY